MLPSQYKIIRSRKFSSGLSLSVHPTRGITVRAPFWIPEIAIRKFVEQKAAWIEQHLSQQNKSSTPSKQYVEGEQHLYFGEQYTLKITTTNIPVRTEAKISDKYLHISMFEGHSSQKQTSEIQEAILRLYLETGIAVITERVNHFSNQLGVDYSRIDIKKVSSIWGSCTSTNKLSFNRKLIMAPSAVVDYVIIHEVCHMVQRNHSSRFWALVAKFDPLYKEHRRWLFRNHLLLSI